MKSFRLTRLSLFAILLSTLISTFHAYAAPKSDLWPVWQKNNPSSQTRVDHSLWQAVLQDYLVHDEQLNQTLFNYAQMKQNQNLRVNQYIETLTSLTPTSLNANEQKAYWINLYNALTVKVILDHYPIESILDIDISPGLFSSGPWGAKLITVENKALSLNDIEHRILRPIWNDNRIHYAVNCASIGCPNLAMQMYDSKRLDQQLDGAAKAFINHPRGVNPTTVNRIDASSIYKWYMDDFGKNESELISHWLKYAEPELSNRLKSVKKPNIRYDYDWALNEPK